MYDMKHWSERTVIALVMKSLDNSITTFSRRGWLTRRWFLTSRQGHGAPNPTWIPVANETVRAMTFWPNRGEANSRPALGAPYVRIAPNAPAVPTTARGALRLRIVENTKPPARCGAVAGWWDEP
jgi:hypothetical protein